VAERRHLTAVEMCERRWGPDPARGRVVPLLTGCAVLFVSGLVAAQTFSPAKLASLPDKADLECPEGDQESTVLFCQVLISATGSVDDEADTQCMGLQRRDVRRARRLTERVTDQVSFEPATMADQAMPVAAGLRIDYLDNAGDCTVLVSENLGIQAATFGINYSAPQRIRREAGLSTAFRRAKPANRQSARVFYLISVAVDRFGQAGDGRVDWVVDDAQAARARRHADALATEEFIPAFVDGEPRPARYYEYLYVPRNSAGVGIPQDTSTSGQDGGNLPAGIP